MIPLNLKQNKNDVFLVPCYLCGKPIIDHRAKIGFPEGKGEFMCDKCYDTWRNE